jgi:RHS repeat-associated protein
VTQTASGTTTDLYYSNQQLLEEEVGGAATARYVWSPVYVNALVLRDRATGSPGTLNERLWVQQDADWNVTALVNSSGAVVERYVYSPYGVVTVLNATWGTLSGSAYAWVYGFQGMRYDSTSGLYKADARWYSPTLQRWTNLDPLRYGAGDDDLYRFAGNSPLDRVDPSGELFWIPFLIGAALVGTGIGGLHVAASHYDSATAALALPPGPASNALYLHHYNSAQWWEAGSWSAIYTGGSAMLATPVGAGAGRLTAAGYGTPVAYGSYGLLGVGGGYTTYQTIQTPWSQLNGPQTLQAAGTLYGPWAGGLPAGYTAFQTGYWGRIPAGRPPLRPSGPFQNSPPGPDSLPPGASPVPSPPQPPQGSVATSDWVPGPTPQTSDWAPPPSGLSSDSVPGLSGNIFEPSSPAPSLPGPAAPVPKVPTPDGGSVRFMTPSEWYAYFGPLYPFPYEAFAANGFHFSYVPQPSPGFPYTAPLLPLTSGQVGVPEGLIDQ